MILVTHSVIGTALTHRYVNAASIFFVALVSHYLFDMIPHWHYDVPRVKQAVNDEAGKKTLRFVAVLLPDIVRICIDLAFGILLSLYLFPGSAEAILVGIAGAVAPDILVGLSRFYPLQLLVWHDKFHRWIHTDVRLDQAPLLGIGTQTALALFFIFFFR